MGRYTILLLIIFTCFSCKKQEKAEPIKNNDFWYWTAVYNKNLNSLALGGTKDTLEIYNSSDTKTPIKIPVKGTITKLAWHPYKNKIAVTTQIADTLSFILDLDSNTRTYLNVEAGARGLQWNSDGGKLALGGNDGNLYIFESNGLLLKRVEQKQKVITDISWSPDDATIVSVGHHVSIYDIKKGTNENLNARDEEVLQLCVEWHPSGNFFVTGDYGDYDFNYPALLQFWDKTGNKLKSIERSKAEYRNIKWSSDGEQLATASDALRIWSKDGNLIREIESDNLLWGLSWKDQYSLFITDESGNYFLKSLE